MQFSVTFDPAMLKRSYARRLFQAKWVLGLAAVLVLLSVIARPDKALWPLQVWGLSGLGLVAVLFGVAWWRQSRAIDRWVGRQQGRPVIYRLEEETFESESESGAVRLKWAVIDAIVIADADTLLMFGGEGTLTLPTAQVPAAALRFMTEKLAARGRKARDLRRRVR